MEVRYEGQPIANVHTGHIRITNYSNTDLADVVISIAYLEGSRIYRDHGSIEGSLNVFPYAEPSLSAVARLEAQDLAYLRNRRDFRIPAIPALNRGSKANIFLLVGRDDQSLPIVQLSCDHTGVKLIFGGPEPQMLFGVPQTQAALVGMLLTMIVVAILISRTSSPWALAFGGWVLGAFGGTIGALVLRAWYWLLRHFK